MQGQPQADFEAPPEPGALNAVYFGHIFLAWGSPGSPSYLLAEQSTRLVQAWPCSHAERGERGGSWDGQMTVPWIERRRLKL